ncbi:hypothetical protein [Desulfovibrio litoralis]|uniref:Flagellar biosynthesis protein FlhF n=1 Tax=Desulfovibrio litoralis DSM 11393 TaxID=1121455 RepID=A0A1M7TCY9_9BACT|nr:hypothetical protein [Desulfovibrio litoralis]SHN68537.1 flagellar biosynthesis protein FlhF [Desulfovibrio litoralis DSM 11393]
MQLKTYIDTTAKAVLEQIKADIGSDAVILSKREGKDENGNPWVEMTAGVERGRSQNQESNLTQGFGGAGTSNDILELNNPASVLDLAKQHIGGSFYASEIESNAPPGWAKWHEEWACIKESLMTLMKPSLRLDQLSPRQRLALEYLQREGVEDTVMLKIYRRLLRDQNASVLASLTEIVPTLAWGGSCWNQHCHMITGPYGIGKTCTLIRLALHFRRMNQGARVLLVNADSVRTGGRLLLKHYADLSGMQYFEAGQAADWRNFLSQNTKKNFDLVLVDLPSFDRNHNLMNFFNEQGVTGTSFDTQDMAVHLVLSPLFGQAQLTELTERYNSPLSGSIIWGKLDEASSFGALVNVSSSTGLPISALSYGSGLRDTLSPADDAMLWRLVFKKQFPS